MGPFGPQLGVFFFLAVGALALFGFLAVASWAGARSQERVSYYTNDMLKKLAESSGDGAKHALEYLQEERHLTAQKRREGLKIGGLVTAAVGIALMIWLKGLLAHVPVPVYLIGVIPLSIGVALLVYVFAMAPSR